MVSSGRRVKLRRLRGWRKLMKFGPSLILLWKLLVLVFLQVNESGDRLSHVYDTTQIDGETYKNSLILF